MERCAEMEVKFWEITEARDWRDVLRLRSESCIAYIERSRHGDELTKGAEDRIGGCSAGERRESL